MVKMRKLQFIGEQFLLNIPKSVARNYGWKKGDFIAVNPKDNGVVEIRKVADQNITRDQAMLPVIKQEALEIFSILLEQSHKVDPISFTNELSQLTHLLGKIRKRGIKINEQ